MALANHFGTLWVNEVARNYLDQLNRPYTANDVEQIARLQIEHEQNLEQQTENGLLFCDTTLLVIKIWMENAYNYCPTWISDYIKNNTYAINLLTNIDLPWQPDPLREHPHLRQFFFDWYYRELTLANSPFVVISGIGAARLQSAIEAVKGLGLA